MLRIQQLTKKFYTLTALRDINLEVAQGDILGILGPNGAGKTTLFKLLTGQLTPDSGSIHTADGTWPTIGYKPERLFFPETMRVAAYLHMVADLGNVPHAQAMVREKLALVGLTDMADKRIRHCSKGMRQRLGIAQALLGEPELLLFDEPSDGLDPIGQTEMQHLLGQLQAAGHTIIMSSHQLEEITAVCTHIAILNRGRLRYSNQMAVALNAPAQTSIHLDGDPAPLADLLHTLHPALSLQGNTVVVGQEALPLRRQLLALLLAAGHDIEQIAPRRATLAEIYAKVTQ